MNNRVRVRVRVRVIVILLEMKWIILMASMQPIMSILKLMINMIVALITTVMYH